MELLLANPLSRRAFATQRWVAAGAVVTLVAAIPWIVLAFLVPGTGMDIAMSNVSAASAGLVALVWCFSGIAFLTGAATGRRGHALAIAGVLAVATYVTKAIAGMDDGWAWMKWLSPFHYFLGADPLHRGWHLGYLTVLVAIGLVTTAAGVIVFNRRDVGV